MKKRQQRKKRAVQQRRVKIENSNNRWRRKESDSRLIEREYW